MQRMFQQALQPIVGKLNAVEQQLTLTQASLNALRTRRDGGGGGDDGGGSRSFDFNGVAQARDRFESPEFVLPLQPVQLQALRVITTGASKGMTNFGAMLLIKDVISGKGIDPPRILQYIMHYANNNNKGARTLPTLSLRPRLVALRSLRQRLSGSPALRLFTILPRPPRCPAPQSTRLSGTRCRAALSRSSKSKPRSPSTKRQATRRSSSSSCSSRKARWSTNSTRRSPSPRSSRSTTRIFRQTTW